MLLSHSPRDSGSSVSDGVWTDRVHLAESFSSVPLLDQVYLLSEDQLQVQQGS